MCSILKWCCPCRICLHLHVNTTRRIPMAQRFLHIPLWLGCFSLKDLILQHILEYVFPNLSSLSLVWVIADQGHTVECNPQATPLISLKKLTDEWQTLVFYVLGLKLPLVPCGIGDGDQSNSNNSKVLYTHSNDSMLKVGWPSQTIGVWTLAQIIVINVTTCVVIPYIMLVPQGHMWYLPWSLIVFLIAGTANKWCTLSISSSPQKYPAEMGLEKYMIWTIHMTSTWLYISISFYFEDEICAMQLQDVSFEKIFPLSELQIEVRNEEVWSLWLDVLSNVEMIPGRACFITRWNCSVETCGNLWKLWVLISDWSKMYERQGGRRNTYIEF